MEASATPIIITDLQEYQRPQGRSSQYLVRPLNSSRRMGALRRKEGSQVAAPSTIICNRTAIKMGFRILLKANKTGATS